MFRRSTENWAAVNLGVFLFLLSLGVSATGTSSDGCSNVRAASGLTGTSSPPSCGAPIAACTGDCNQNAEVTIEEIVTGVAIALGWSPLTTCPNIDRDGGGEVTLDEIIAAVRSALESCPLDTGAIFEVRVCEDERFRVLLVDPGVIAQAERILAGEEPRKIVMGELRCGSGNFNGPWSWHLEPASVTFADAAIELCDGCPSFVEAERSYWLDTVGRYCPWTAELLRRVR